MARVSMMRLYELAHMDDQEIAIIRDITLRLLELWGRVPTVSEIRAAIEHP